MDSKYLYNMSSNELMQARNMQAQISPKELELKLLDINGRYNSYNPYSSDRIKRQSIEMDIITLRNNMKAHLNNAISYALLLAEQDIRSNNTYSISMATYAIDSICSFLTSYKDNFKPSFLAQMKLYELSSQLMLSGINMLNLKNAIDRLKSLCNI